MKLSALGLENRRETQKKKKEGDSGSVFIDKYSYTDKEFFTWSIRV